MPNAPQEVNRMIMVDPETTPPGQYNAALEASGQLQQAIEKDPLAARDALSDPSLAFHMTDPDFTNNEAPYITQDPSKQHYAALIGSVLMLTQHGRDLHFDAGTSDTTRNNPEQAALADSTGYYNPDRATSDLAARTLALQSLLLYTQYLQHDQQTEQ
jgi:hypothetical protein